MEGFKVILGIYLVLISLAQADTLEILNALPKDQVRVTVTLIDSFFIFEIHVTGSYGNKN